MERPPPRLETKTSWPQAADVNRQLPLAFVIESGGTPRSQTIFSKRCGNCMFLLFETAIIAGINTRGLILREACLLDHRRLPFLGKIILIF